MLVWSTQVAMKASSHRGHHRAHLNSRSTPAFAKLACEPMSRWHRYAFTTLDVSDRVNITVSIDASGVRSIYVENVLRTQIPDFSTFDPTNVLAVTINQSWHGYLCRLTPPPRPSSIPMSRAHLTPRPLPPPPPLSVPSFSPSSLPALSQPILCRRDISPSH